MCDADTYLGLTTAMTQFRSPSFSSGVLADSSSSTSGVSPELLSPNCPLSESCGTPQHIYRATTGVRRRVAGLKDGVFGHHTQETSDANLNHTEVRPRDTHVDPHCSWSPPLMLLLSGLADVYHTDRHLYKAPPREPSRLTLRLIEEPLPSSPPPPTLSRRRRLRNKMRRVFRAGR